MEWTPLPAVFLGDTVFGQISVPGENDSFGFSGVQGQKIYFDHLSTEGNLHFDVYSPSDRLVVDNNWHTGITLQETGTYEIVIDGQEDGTGETTGNYKFRLLNKADSPLIELDTDAIGTFDHGEKLYRFNQFLECFS